MLGIAWPGGKEVPRKNHEAQFISLDRAGNFFFLPQTGRFRWRGTRRGARWSRRFLRKNSGTFDSVSLPADAFYAEPPFPRATS
jgi:hypothetical protein